MRDPDRRRTAFMEKTTSYQSQRYFKNGLFEIAFPDFSLYAPPFISLPEIFKIAHEASSAHHIVIQEIILLSTFALPCG